MAVLVASLLAEEWNAGGIGFSGVESVAGLVEPVVQPRHPPLRYWPDLRSGRSERIGGLLAIAALDSFPTRPATSDADGEPGDHRGRPRRQVGLELLGVTLVYDVTSTMRAAARQRGVEFPVDAGRGHAMTVTAVPSSAFASRTFRLVGRLALGERCGLTFTRTPRLHQLTQRPSVGSGRITRRRVASRNSPSYAPLEIRWGTPLS